ncbi:hypothetical protein KJ656_08945 [bacterium]|nr:hypothetical protein [bacterium]
MEIHKIEDKKMNIDISKIKIGSIGNAIKENIALNNNNVELNFEDKYYAFIAGENIKTGECRVEFEQEFIDRKEAKANCDEELKKLYPKIKWKGVDDSACE